MTNQTTDKKILFATTSKDKIRRLKLMLGRSSKTTILSLKDVGLDKVEEPVEDGDSEIENAKIKAKYYYDLLAEDSKMPVLAQDDGVYTPNLPAKFSPGKDVKATVQRHMGASSQHDVYQYWIMVASQYPMTECNFSWNYALFDGKEFRNYSATVTTNLSTDREVSEEHILSGAPLGLVAMLEVNGAKKYFCDLSAKDYELIGRQKLSELVRDVG
jgi:inosine/xanthosine triphosphate pyrophosphatase family protein